MLAKIVFFIFLTCLSLSAWADLLVSPTRIVFGERDRVKEVILINTGNEKRSYRVEWSEKTVSTTGNYINLNDGLPEFALSPFVRFSPRQVTLQPGERQVVKLLVRKNNQMKMDEYRSHLRFFALPIERDPAPEQRVDGIELKLDVLTSYTIPVIYRTINPQPEINLEAVEVRQNSSASADILVTVSKQSTTSITGSLFAYINDRETGKKVRIGELNSVTMFHESDQVTFRVKWQEFEKYNTYSGLLELEYVGSKEFTNIKFDQMAINLTL